MTFDEMEKALRKVGRIYQDIRDRGIGDFMFQLPSIRRLVVAILAFGGALDASDTGTGKTAVACAVAKVLDRVLFVVCPKNVMPAWKRMADLFGVRCVVINYELLRRGTTAFGRWKPNRSGTIPKYEFEYTFAASRDTTLFVFDECHRMKDFRTLNCKLGIGAIMQGFKVLALSATSADNPMHMKFASLLTKMVDHPAQFYGWMLDHGVRKGRFGLEFVGGRRYLSDIHSRIFPSHGSRIRIADLGDAFPQTQIISDPYEMNGATEQITAIYAAMREEIARLEASKRKDKGACVLTELLRARQAVELLKVPTLIQMAEDGLAEGMSVVVILNFTDSIRAQAWAKRLHGRATNQITGDTPQEVRQQLIDGFNADQEDFLLMNIKAGGLGISLHGTPTSRPRLVLISPTFSGIDLKQALGRCHRAGGAHSIQKIVWAAGTVEEKACDKVRARIQRVSILNDNELDDALRI